MWPLQGRKLSPLSELSDDWAPPFLPSVYLEKKEHFSWTAPVCQSRLNLWGGGSPCLPRYSCFSLASCSPWASRLSIMASPSWAFFQVLKDKNILTKNEVKAHKQTMISTLRRLNHLWNSYTLPDSCSISIHWTCSSSDSAASTMVPWWGGADTHQLVMNELRLQSGLIFSLWAAQIIKISCHTVQLK